MRSKELVLRNGGGGGREFKVCQIGQILPPPLSAIYPVSTPSHQPEADTFIALKKNAF
jgi:hypothetical protein